MAGSGDPATPPMKMVDSPMNEGLITCNAQPLPGAAMAYLRGKWTPSHVHLKRLRPAVAAKQNGFWAIVS